MKLIFKLLFKDGLIDRLNKDGDIQPRPAYLMYIPNAVGGLRKKRKDYLVVQKNYM